MSFGTLKLISVSLLLSLFCHKFVNCGWVHDDLNGIWAYEHPTDHILTHLFAPLHVRNPACHRCQKLAYPDCKWEFGGKLCYPPSTLYYSGERCAEVNLSCFGRDLKAHGRVKRTGRIGSFRLTLPHMGPGKWFLEYKVPEYIPPIVLQCSENGTWIGTLWKKYGKREQLEVDHVYCV